MGSIYKALMHAAEERDARRRAAVAAGTGTAVGQRTANDPTEEMLELVQSIESLPIQPRRKVIHFVGSRDGARASVLARDFASASASAFGLSVLLVGRGRAEEARDMRTKEGFDLVVLTSGSPEGRSGSPGLSPRASVVVLVFESEVTTTEGPEEIGLASVLEQIARGRLFPQQALSCQDIPLLLLTPPDA